jgi:hypothetical protein
MVLPFLLSTFQSVIMNSAMILATKVGESCNIWRSGEFSFGSALSA